MLFASAADGDELRGILEYTTDPIVSSDIVGSPYSVDLRLRPHERRGRDAAEGHRLV